jgi:hypothetical protein
VFDAALKEAMRKRWKRGKGGRKCTIL